jgi:hypothetical protein
MAFWLIYKEFEPYTQDESQILVKRRFDTIDQARAYMKEQKLNWPDSIVVEGEIVITGAENANESGKITFQSDADMWGFDETIGRRGRDPWLKSNQ